MAYSYFFGISYILLFSKKPVMTTFLMDHFNVEDYIRYDISIMFDKLSDGLSIMFDKLSDGLL